MPYKPTGRKPGRPPKNPVARQDGAYENVFLGVGNRRDRSNATTAKAARYISHQELENLYEGDGFARRIIDLPADEMVRAGFELSGIDDPSDVMARIEYMCVLNRLSDAVRWADLYGGALAVLVVNDGGDLTDPLNFDSVKELEAIRVYDRHQVSRAKKYSDPADKRFGKTEIWLISPVGGGTPYEVHESRTLIFDGAAVPERIRTRNDGWGNSKLQQCYNELTRMGMAYMWANALLERAQQAVHGIPGLSNLLRSKDGEELVKKRIDLVDMSRSINNTIVIDSGMGDASGETYELKSTSFAGVPDIMDRFALALCSVSGLPESLLFGRQKSGLNSGDKTGLENWYAEVHKGQKDRLLPALDRVVSLIMKSMGVYTDDYLIHFCPLSVPSEKDIAETEYKKAQARQIYLESQVLDPSEVRKKLADEGGYPIDDVELIGEVDTGDENGQEENPI